MLARIDILKSKQNQQTFIYKNKCLKIRGTDITLHGQGKPSTTVP